MSSYTWWGGVTVDILCVRLLFLSSLGQIAGKLLKQRTSASMLFGSVFIRILFWIRRSVTSMDCSGPNSPNHFYLVAQFLSKVTQFLPSHCFWTMAWNRSWSREASVCSKITKVCWFNALILPFSSNMALWMTSASAFETLFISKSYTISNLGRGSSSGTCCIIWYGSTVHIKCWREVGDPWDV